jgi:tetratricopeptide (TPR) repeat protein
MNDAAAPVRGPARPFPGLRPFSYSEHDYYFGRSDQIYALYRMLDRSRFVAVVGSSGSGKSSLVFAGLHPLLDDDTAQIGGRHWVWSEMSPKDTPIDGLIGLLHDLARTFPLDAEEESGSLELQRSQIEYLLRRSSRGIVDVLNEIGGLKDKTLVLVADQFEELFRYARPSQLPDRAKASFQREEAVAFVQLLLAASRDPDSNARIVLTMRSDFIGDCAIFRGLPEAVSQTQFLVPGLTRDQFEEVIRKPIELNGATIESGLVERLLNDISDESEQLPVLQHCLLRLWEQAGKPRDGAAGPPHGGDGSVCRNITVDDYIAVGRVAGALSQHAEEILDGLPGLMPVAERVFRALSDVDKEGRATRRTVKFARLIDETKDREDDLRKVLDRFRADDCSFLRPRLTKEPQLLPDTLIDVGHEALLRHWERMSGDPEATGEATDPRPIGWTRMESSDGRHYLALLSMTEGASADQEVLPRGQVVNTLNWWRTRTPAWTQRYGSGDGFNRVQRMLERSRASRQMFKWLVGGAAVGICALLIVAGALAVTLYQDQQRFATSLKKLTNVFGQSMQTGIKKGDISFVAAKDMAGPFEAAVEKLASDPQDAEVKEFLGQQLLKVADIYQEQNDTADESATAKVAQKFATQWAASDQNNPKWQLLLYDSEFRIADCLVSSSLPSDRQQGLALYLDAQSIANRLAEDSHNDVNSLYNVAFVDNKVGETYELLGQSSDAMNQFNAALPIAHEVATAPSASVDQQAIYPSTLTKLGADLLKTDAAKAQEYFQQAISFQEQILQNAPKDKAEVVSGNLLLSYRSIGDVLKNDAQATQSSYQPAFDQYNAAIKLGNQLLTDFPDNTTLWLTYISGTYDRYVAGLKAAGDLADALAQYQNELGVWQKFVAKDPTNPAWQSGLKSIQTKIAALPASSTQSTLSQSAQSPPTQTPVNSVNEAKP